MNDPLTLISGSILLVGFVLMLAVKLWGPPPSKKRPDWLDTVLFPWNSQNPFRVRDLLSGGLLIFGRSGSGKTSSSGLQVAHSVVQVQTDTAGSQAQLRTGGLILAAKPDDLELWRRIFRHCRPVE